MHIKHTTESEIPSQVANQYDSYRPYRLTRNSLHVRQPKAVPILGFQIPRNGIRILFQWKLDSGFQLFVGFWIPSAVRFPDSKALDSGFHEQKFPGFPYTGLKKY